MRLVSIASIAASLCLAASAFAQTPYTWGNVPIVGGGFVSGIITHPAAKGVMYARTDVGGAYRFEPANKRWIPITDWVPMDEWTYTGIESIAVDPASPDGVYLAAGTYTNNWAPQNGAIFRSTDAGKTWQKAMLPFKNGGNENGRFMGERLVVDPKNSNVIYFATRNNGLWKSEDKGASFAQVDNFPVKTKTDGIGLTFVLFDKNAPQTIYVGSSAKDMNLYRSTDGGKSWSEVPNRPTGLITYHGVQDTDGTIYFCYGNGPGPNDVGGGAVYKLDPKKDIWTEISPVKPGDNDKFGYGGITLDAQKPGTIIVSTLCRWARGDGAFRSTDGGKTWTDLKPNSKRDASSAPFLKWGRPEADFGHWIGDIEIDPFDSGHVMYVTGMGIWATDDVTAADGGKPTQWYVGSVGIEECVVNDVASPPAGAKVLSSMWDIGGFRHENLDRSPEWGFFQPPQGRNTAIDFAELKPDVVVRVYGGKSGGAWSEDNGKSWTEFATNPGGDGSVAVSADGTGAVVIPENGPAKFTADKGKSWSAAKGAPAKARVVADRVKPGAYYALDGHTLVASTDGGASFAFVSDAQPGYLRSTPGKEGHLWIAGDSGLLRSTDGGKTFEPIPGFTKAHRIGFGKPVDGSDYPAAYVIGWIDEVYGIYRSDDQGENWVRINDDQHQFAYLNAITGDPREYGRVYVASSSRGIVTGAPSK